MAEEKKRGGRKETRATVVELADSYREPTLSHTSMYQVSGGIHTKT